jgi:dihydrofolate reductase
MLVAVSENNGIGKNNQLLWHLPADLKHFKNITSGGTVIMGRKTYESIGKPLPNRRNIVISRQKALEIEGIETVTSLSEAIKMTNEPEVFIIGGAEIFNLALAQSTKIYLTRVHQHFDADTFFPALNAQEWIESDKQSHLPDEKNKFAYTFSTLTKI